MKLFMALFCIFTLSFAQVHTKASLKIALPLLKKLNHIGIPIGEGSTDVYAFIDPLCPHSRNFVTMVAHNQKLQKKYHYIFLLYTLPRLHSEQAVKAILTAKNHLLALKKVMIHHQRLTQKHPPSSVLQAIKMIQTVAKKLDIYKRPYLFLVKPKKASQ